MAVSDISITITQNSQSIANNTSNITVKGKCKTTGPSMDYNTRTGTVTIDGKDYSFTSKFPETSTITIFTKTVNVTHNPDGKKTVSASFKVTTGMTGTLPGGVISASTSKTLTTIPRNSKVSLSSTNFNIGTKITINTNRASSSFTHTAVITYNGKTIRTQTGIGASYSWDTSELYKYIPNGNSATGKVTLTTYSGSTKIGSSTEVTFTAKVVNSNPTFSNFEYYDNNSKTIALTGNNQVFIKKYSNAIIKIPVAYKMVTKNSATPSKYIAIAGSASNEKAYSDTANVEIPINSINSTTISVYAVDSRNNQTPVSKAISTIDFKECVLQSLNVERENGVGTYIEITLLGTYNNINFGAVLNTIETAILRCKAVGTTTWEEFDIKQLLTIENGKISCSNVRFTQKEFILGTEYDIEIKITDKLSSDSETASVNSGKVLMSAVKEYGVCFGGLYDKSVGGPLQGKTETNVINILEKLGVKTIRTANTNLNDYRETGLYYFETDYTPTNIPGGANGFLQVISNENWTKQIWYRTGTVGTNDHHTWVRTVYKNDSWGAWVLILTGKQTIDNLTSSDTISPLSANQGRILLNNKISWVGKVVITATNSNPSSILGGTWELIDKEFSNNRNTNGFALNTTNCKSCSFEWARAGHTITLMISYVPKVKVADSTLQMGTVSLSTLGISRFPHSIYAPGYTDGGNCIIMNYLGYNNGSFETLDVVSDPYVASGQTCKFFVTSNIPYQYMNDSACNKFYWKRTA